MEKTIQITIASTQFQMTESAYDTLRSYLDRLKAHFGDTPDSVEIMRDIESRIAEKFLEAKHTLITEKIVSAVIAEIGDASAFSEDSAGEQRSHTEPPTDVPARKRLYRDMDNAYLGGVSSGIAAYFNIDPLWIRLAFLISIFSGGAGIVIYLILWFLIPEAKSASQKLEMSGKPVNLDSIAHIVKERFDEAEKSGAIARGAHAIDSVMRRVLGFIGKLFGGLISFGSFLAFIGVSVMLGIVLFNWNAPWNDIPHKEFISPILLKSLLAAGYLAIIIPLVFIFTLGQRLLKSRAVLSTTVGFGLMGVWALSLVGCGVFGTKIAGDYYAYTASSPEYAQTIDEHAVEAFSSIDVQNTHVTVRSGDSYMIRVTGRRIDMDNASTSVKDGVLTITTREHEGPCLFCNHSVPSITVTVPALSSITAHNGSVSLDKLSVPLLTLDLQNTNLSGTALVPELTLHAASSWTGLTVTSKALTVDARNARVELDGTTDTLSVTARNASVDTESLKSTTATVDAQNSSVRVDTATLNTTNDRGSDIQNAGTEAGVSETVDSN